MINADQACDLVSQSLMYNKKYRAAPDGDVACSYYMKNS